MRERERERGIEREGEIIKDVTGCYSLVVLLSVWDRSTGILSKTNPDGPMFLIIMTS